MSYPIKLRALAVEYFLQGTPQRRIAKIVGCSPDTVGAWYLDYIGYKGDNIELITKKSKIMNILEQKIYTDLFFTKPTEVFNIIDELQKFPDQEYLVELYGDMTVLEYPVPLESNRVLLTQIIDVEKYIERLNKEYTVCTNINNIECIELAKLIYDMTNHYGITIQVDKDENCLVYCSEDNFSMLSGITYKTENPNYNTEPIKKAITNDTLVDAANEYAKTILGSEQFKVNPNAVQSIGNDFINGAKFILDIISSTDQGIINLVDSDLEL